MAPSHKAPTASTVLDLDGQLAAIDLSPVPVVLKGQTYQVRRDLTGAEIIACWAAINAKKDREAFELLVGDGAEELDRVIESLPQQHMTVAVQAIFRAAELIPAADAGSEVQGESSAS